MLAQRLVRKICHELPRADHAQHRNPGQLDLTPDDVLDKKFYRGRGCAACNNTGFKGRTGLYELMLMNDQLRELINRGASTEQLRDVALQTGMRPLRMAGIGKGLQRRHHASKK